MSGFYSELKRRNVARAGVAYLVIAWLLLQVADTLSSALHLPDWVTPFVILLLVIGFIPALVFTWVFDITPDGIVRTSDVDAGQSVSAESGRRLNYVTIAAVLMATAFLAWTKFGTEPEVSGDAAAPEASVAVLPFINMSGQEENEYFSDGLTETLLHMLAQDPNLRVSARTSSFAFKNKNLDVREIAAQLGVAHVLEGSVQRVGDKVRITAQLIRASDGSHLWSEKYDRNLDDIFVIHDEIALTVGTALSKSLLGDADREVPDGLATDNINALDFYLRALPEFTTGSYESMQNAEKFLKSALVADPNFTDAKTKLANTYVRQGMFGFLPNKVATAKASSLFEQVLIAQPSNVSARVFFVLDKMAQDRSAGKPGAILAAIEQLLELVHDAPSSVEVRVELAQLLQFNSKPERALEQYEIAIDLDPLNTETHNLLAESYATSRDWDAAHKQLNRSVAIEPRQIWATTILAEIHRRTGNAVEFIRQMENLAEMDPLDHEYPQAIAELLYELDLIEEGDRFRKQVMAIAPTSPAALKLEIVRAIRTDSEEESLATARQLIRDNANNRKAAWLRAFRHLMLAAVLRDRTQSELDYVSEYIPGFADFEDSTVGSKAYLGRSNTLEIWRSLDTEQGVLRRIDLVLARFAALEVPVARVPLVNIDILLLQGKLEAAIEAALADLFSDTVLKHMYIKDRFVTPLYAEFVADPRIEAALQKWDEEVATSREKVREYLAGSD